MPWSAYLGLLREFKQEHGHCRVQQHYETEHGTALGTWVSAQRRHHRNFAAGRGSQITQERIDSLDALGFEWDALAAQWSGFYQQLVKYKRKFGDCLVRRRYQDADGVNLGVWVSTQRIEYKRLQAGKTSTMTKDRIDKLNALGFDWSEQKKKWPGKKSKKA